MPGHTATSSTAKQHSANGHATGDTYSAGAWATHAVACNRRKLMGIVTLPHLLACLMPSSHAPQGGVLSWQLTWSFVDPSLSAGSFTGATPVPGTGKCTAVRDYKTLRLHCTFPSATACKSAARQQGCYVCPLPNAQGHCSYQAQLPCQHT